MALLDDPTPAAASARNKSAKPNPTAPAEPAVKNSRRVTPSQCVVDFPVSLSMVLDTY
jgi:hypothetical protein